MNATRAWRRAATIRPPTLAADAIGPILGALAECGFDTIDVPIVWREHEIAPAEIDFEHGRRNLAAVFRAVSARGLRAIVRLGPSPSIDAVGLGIPEWVLADRECQSRTARGAPVITPDPPRAVAMPSIVRETFRSRCLEWIRSVSTWLYANEEARGCIDAIYVGMGPEPAFRVDPEILALPRDDRRRLVGDFIESLAAEVIASGAPTNIVGASVQGNVDVAPWAAGLAKRRPINVAIPLPGFGSRAIWRAVRSALAVGAENGLHVDLFAGSPPLFPPVRGAHSVEAARVAMCAGARSLSVRMGCADERWVGAIVSERGQPRAVAKFWRDLFEWSERLGNGHELSADIVEPIAVADCAAYEPAVGSLSGALASFVGWTGADLASDSAPCGQGADCGQVGQDIESAESRLLGAAIPVRRVPAGFEGKLAYRAGEEDITAFVRRARAMFRPVLLDVQPRGGALVRATLAEGEVTLDVLSCSSAPARVTTPAADGWHCAGERIAPKTVATLAPGASLSLQWEGTVELHPAKRDPPRRRKTPSSEPAETGALGAASTPGADGDAGTQLRRSRRARREPTR